VERAVVDDDLDVDHRIAGDYAALHRLFDTGLDRVDEFLRNYAADDLVLEAEALARLLRDGLIVQLGAQAGGASAGKRVTGVLCETGERLTARAVILATGTYLRGRIILGETIYDSGPNGQRPAMALSDSLKALGLKLMRFKTGTPARVDRRTIDFAKTIVLHWC